MASVIRPVASDIPTPFADFAPPIRPQGPLRAAITALYRAPEPECLPPLLDAATLAPGTRAAVAGTARALIEALRAKHRGAGSTTGRGSRSSSPRCIRAMPARRRGG